MFVKLNHLKKQKCEKCRSIKFFALFQKDCDMAATADAWNLKHTFFNYRIFSQETVESFVINW